MIVKVPSPSHDLWPSLNFCHRHSAMLVQASDSRSVKHGLWSLHWSSIWSRYNHRLPAKQVQKGSRAKQTEKLTTTIFLFKKHLETLKTKNFKSSTCWILKNRFGVLLVLTSCSSNWYCSKRHSLLFVAIFRGNSEVERSICINTHILNCVATQ